MEAAFPAVPATDASPNCHALIRQAGLAECCREYRTSPQDGRNAAGRDGGHVDEASVGILGIQQVRCLTNMARIRQSRPEFGLGFQVSSLRRHSRHSAGIIRGIV
jgi:hypothetical protein